MIESYRTDGKWILVGPTITDAAKTTAMNERIDNRQAYVVEYHDVEAGKNYVYNGGSWYEIASGGGGGGGTSNYLALTNKPSINGITLNGNKTTSELSILPEASWTSTVTVNFSILGDIVELGEETFVRVSDLAFSAARLDGAVFAMEGTSETLTIDESMLTDMSSYGITGTLIDIPNIGPLIFSCTQIGGGVSYVGMYMHAEAAPTYASLVTMSYTDSVSASTRAIGAGTIQMQDGETTLPTGVVYLQYED